MIHVPVGMVQESVRFYRTTQNGMQFKTCELFISGIFHLIFSDHGCSRVTETTENETVNEEKLPYCLITFAAKLAERKYNRL